MRIIPLEEIKPVVTMDKAIAAVRSNLISYAKKLIVCPEPMQILFHHNNGDLSADCHIKSAYGIEQKYFVIKIASGFYDNEKKGLPVNNGMMVVMSSATGTPLAILDDQGWLTSQRTAAAGALAAGLKSTSKNSVVGIVGTGNQAELQALAICSHLGLSSVAVYGRSEKKANILCERLRRHGLKTLVTTSVRSLCHQCSILVTTTPSTKPIIKLSDLPESIHIIAIGADSPGKVEICPSILAVANIIVTDDHEQCLSHGDFGVAVRQGQVNKNSDIAFGTLLSRSEEFSRSIQKGISVVDLTGLGVQDLAVATLVLEQFENI